MKTIISLLTILLISFSGLSQINVGITRYYPDTRFAEQFGPILGISHKNIYIEISGNLAFGKGKRVYEPVYQWRQNEPFILVLDRESTNSYQVYKKRIRCMNIGYHLNLTDNLILTPTIGMLSVDNIYQNTTNTDCYYYADMKYLFNYGIGLSYYFTTRIGIMTGLYSQESYKFSIIYKLWQK